MRERLRQHESLTPSEKVGREGGEDDDECSPGQHLAQGHHPGHPQADEAGWEEWTEVLPVPEDGRDSADPGSGPAGQAGQGED